LCEILPVVVSGDSPQPQIKGTVGLDKSSKPSGSDTFPLDVVAGLSADRKTLTLSVINPTKSTQKFNLNVTGLKLSGTGKLWQIAADDVNDSNVGGEKPEVDIVEIPVKQIPKKFIVAPISINLYEFEAG
jgi:alpha-N-arabinofuranosidase